jgi:hypothetical protein
LPTAEGLHYLTVGKLFLAVVGDEKLVAVGVLESFDFGDVFLVHCGEFEGREEDVGLSQMV